MEFRQLSMEPQMAHSPAVLVTGGSGYIGSHLVRALSEQGETVVSMYRHRLPEPRDKVFPVCSDLSTAELLAAPLRGVHTVVHLAWERNFLGPEPEVEAPDSPRGGTSRNLKLLCNLLSAMEKAQTKRIIFVSALGASSRADDAFLREKYQGEFYTLNSRIAERIVVRPSLIYGGDASRDRFINAIKRVMRFPGFYPLPRCEKLLYPLHLNDLVSLLKSLVKVTLPEPIALVDMRGEEPYKVEELFKLVNERFNKGSRLPIASVVGHSLLPLFEKESKGEREHPKLRHFLALGQELEGKVRQENPLVEFIPRAQHSFREVMRSELPANLSGVCQAPAVGK